VSLRYRKIVPRFWRDEKVKMLDADGKLISLYCLTAQANRIGIFLFSPGAAMEELDFERERFDAAFSRVIQSLAWQWDKENRVLYIPSWWKYNAPENANVLKGNLKDLDEIPSESPLIKPFAENLSNLDATFHQTFRECMDERLGKRSGEGPPDVRQIRSRSSNRSTEQEQEQEQKQEQEKVEPALKPSADPKPARAGARVMDVSYDEFAAEFKKRNGFEYGSTKGDFIRLADLRKRFGIPSHSAIPNWARAIGNYFNTGLSRYSVADLATRFDVFVRSELNDYNKPVNHVRAGGGRVKFVSKQGNR
jgi:hypothetical protein